ncbi:sensor histidine kinase [Bradyrhizobium sp.]|uniref:sensor histidine kinase n=1 Tax=Bradyrhizobium sp. TaxID=376 RepID=UPI0025B7E9A8|nr:ATP-binding protein [Bradyrhizobium sp.]MBV8920802.1 PAS domain-containing protein [Bradyrhizobium sp.]
MRRLKRRNSPARQTTGVRKRPTIGSEVASDRLYWTYSGDLLFVVRPSTEGRFFFEDINPAFASLLGISPEDISKTAVSDCMTSQDARSVHEAFHSCLAEGGEIRARHLLTLGRSRQHIETVVSPIRDPRTGNIIRLVGSHRAALEAPSEEAPDWNAGANLGLASLQDQIQQRIASDLHDSTCQHLIAASLGLMRIRTNLGDAVSTERLCDDVDTSIDEALREIRAFAYLLHPQDLTTDGLKATIEHYAKGFAARTSLQVGTRIAPDVDRLPYAKQRTLLRVVQEALTNVFRHAKATQVEVVLEPTDGRFRLMISDDGRGMPVDRSRSGLKAILPGVGIPAMRARLRQIGGTLEIWSGPQTRRAGTVLCAVLPHDLAARKRNRRKVTSIIRAHTGTQ